MSSAIFTLVVSVGLVVFYNGSFWKQLFEVRGPSKVGDLFFLLGFFALLVAAANLLLSLAAFPIVQKPLTIALLMSAALGSYFMSTYGVVLDSSMMQNAFETDPGEVLELISGKLLLYFVFLGIVPAILVVRTQIHYRTWPGELRVKVGSILASLAVIGIVGMLFYSDFVALGTNHHDLRHRITPENLLVGTAKQLRRALTPSPGELEVVGGDAVIRTSAQSQRKRTLAILVVGETARAREFSLNGYGRETNPSLSKQAIVNFGDVSSCGTSTAVSLPCMFSGRGRRDYRDGDSGRREGLLDVLAHAGIRVLWRENNSGCKGVCDRVEVQDLSLLQVPEYCDSTECFDEVLLEGLSEILATSDRDVLVVLHQKGSHGPAYYQRYPKQFERFTPICASNQLQDCSVEEVVNTYDNTILYTDFFLGRVIEFLKERRDRYNTAMLYISDHGESLGEGNLYLHGLPYVVAPEEQTKVPFVVWLSDELERESAIDAGCLEAHRDQPISHDNLFHSVLGLMNVETRSREAGLDIFAPCRESEVELASRTVVSREAVESG